MPFLRYTPAPPLNAYINQFYYLDCPMPYPREKILPLPWVDLKVNFGGEFRAYRQDCAEPFTTCTDSWWLGLWSSYHIVEWPPDIELFVVDFKPGGAYPFLQLPLVELHNQAVALDMIWGRFAAEIRERLYAAPTIATGFALLEQLLLSRLHEAPAGFQSIQYAMTEIARHEGVLSIRALSDHIGMSQKHLIAQFKRLVGGTPKEVARLYRFQRVLRSISVTHPVDWTRVAHDACYYDQSHFNKEFEAFTGHSPNDYLRQRRRIHAENPHHAAQIRQLSTG
jgi:AraC-like DNA-binding protein